MAKKNILIDVIAEDRATSVFKKVADGSIGMAQSINNSLLRFNSVIRHYNNSMSDFNRFVQRSMIGAGKFVYDFTSDAIKEFTELEKQHAKTMGAMANNYDKTADAQRRFIEDQKRLRDDAIRLGTIGPDGRGTLARSTDVSYAQESLIKAGRSAKEIIDSEVVPVILKFAGGNDLSIDVASDFATTLGTQFNIPMNQWGDMLDKVTKAADISVVDVDDIIQSMKYAGGIASSLNRPLEEILGAVAVMGNAGLKGSMAGTGIQAFLTRILSPVGKSEAVLDKAPGIAGIALEAFIAETTDANGTFKEMSYVTDKLDEAMSLLNDTEAAWFAQKLFGLFQMKAAYALKRPGTNGENVLEETIKDINELSAGTNDAKWDIMLASQYGSIEALKNAWQGTKVDIGSRLSPITKSISTELFNFLSNNGNYTIDFTKLKESIEESGNLISEKYGEQIGEAVKNIGNMGIDASRIVGAVSPIPVGMTNFAFKLVGGDISGAFEELEKAVRATNDNIDILPEELQGLAKGARNAMLALGALATFNIGTKFAEMGTSLYRTLSGNKIHVGKTTMASTSTSVNSTNVSLRSTSTTLRTPAINATLNKMTVTANIVNVYGSQINNRGKSTGGSPNSGGTPPSVPPGPYAQYPNVQPYLPTPIPQVPITVQPIVPTPAYGLPPLPTAPPTQLPYISPIYTPPTVDTFTPDPVGTPVGPVPPVPSYGLGASAVPWGGIGGGILAGGLLAMFALSKKWSTESYFSRYGYGEYNREYDENGNFVKESGLIGVDGKEKPGWFGTKFIVPASTVIDESVPSDMKKSLDAHLGSMDLGVFDNYIRSASYRYYYDRQQDGKSTTLDDMTAFSDKLAEKIASAIATGVLNTNMLDNDMNGFFKVLRSITDSNVDVNSNTSGAMMSAMIGLSKVGGKPNSSAVDIINSLNRYDASNFIPKSSVLDSNQVNFNPSISVSAPSVKVMVTVDQNGRILEQKSLIDDNNIEVWYNRQSSRYGKGVVQE